MEQSEEQLPFALVEIEKKVLVPHEVIHLAITFTPVIFTLPTKHELKLKNRAQLAPLTQQHLIKTKLKHKSRAFVIRAAVFLFKIKPQAVSLLVLPCLTLSISHEYSINILAGGVWRILEHKHWALRDIDFALGAKIRGSPGIDTSRRLNEERWPWARKWSWRIKPQEVDAGKQNTEEISVQRPWGDTVRFSRKIIRRRSRFGSIWCLKHLFFLRSLWF